MPAPGSRLVSEGNEVAFTAVYSRTQAGTAAATVASWIIPCVDRAHRFRPAQPLVPVLRRTVDALNNSVQIIAASIKPPTHAVTSLLQGSNVFSVPLMVIAAMGQGPLTDDVVRESAEAGS